MHKCTHRPRVSESVVAEDREMVRSFIPIDPAWTNPIVFPDYRIRRPDGSVVWISARAFPVRDPSGPRTGTVHAFVHKS